MFLHGRYLIFSLSARCPPPGRSPPPWARSSCRSRAGSTRGPGCRSTWPRPASCRTWSRWSTRGATCGRPPWFARQSRPSCHTWGRCCRHPTSASYHPQPPVRPGQEKELRPWHRQEAGQSWTSAGCGHLGLLLRPWKALPLRRRIRSLLGRSFCWITVNKKVKEAMKCCMLYTLFIYLCIPAYSTLYTTLKDLSPGGLTRSKFYNKYFRHFPRSFQAPAISYSCCS